MIDCVSGGAFSGYVAAMLWRSVQVDRPSSSTSGGQSDAGVVIGTTGLVVLPVEDFIIAIHAADDVQVRHLTVLSVIDSMASRLGM